MANISITRNKTLPDSAEKSDFHDLIDTATASISNITNDDIDSAANISDGKLATITTAGKVDGSALTNLANIPSAAGDIPAANLNNAPNDKVKADSNDTSIGYLSDKVDGSTLEVDTANHTLKVKDGGIGQTQVSGVLGDYTSKSFDTVYHADTDGFVVVNGQRTTGTSYTEIYADENNPPTTLRAKDSPSVDGYWSACVPVKKGWYWKVASNDLESGDVHWVPLGS